MKAYCINLDRRPDRRAHMWGEFERRGLVVERFAAVDGQDPEVTAACAAATQGSPRPISPGAFAAFESHRGVWEELLRGGDGHAMILEDDLVLAESFTDLVTDTGWVPDDADLVKLETVGNRQQLEFRAARQIRGRRLVPLRSYHSGSAAYVISRRAAQALLARPQTGSVPVDEVLFDPHIKGGAHRVYQVVPAPAAQGNVRAVRAVAESWAETSISEHWSGTYTDWSDRKEGLQARLRRRVREELRAIGLGSRYTVVPFG